MIEVFWQLVQAAPINVYFALTSLPLGFVLAIGLALAANGRRALPRRLAGAYIYLFRGTPLFIQLFFFYAALRASGIARVRNGDGERVLAFMLDALAIGPLVLVLNTAAYTAVIFTNAIQAIPKGELEAADAFGFSPWKKFRAVTWPNMLRIAWPAYTNEATFLFLATTLVYAVIPLTTRPGGVAYRDVFFVANEVASKTFNPFIAFLPAMALFVLMVLGLLAVFGRINQRLNTHLNTHLHAAPARASLLRSFFR